MQKSVYISLFLVLAFLAAPAVRAQDGGTDQEPSGRPKAIEYSDAYETRARIHRIASIATLPLLGTEALLGQSVYNDPNSSESAKRGAHIAVGTAITGLFALNTVTGVWNLWEARNDPHRRTLRLVHGILMLGADAGFAAAFGTAPGGRRNLVTFDANKQTHRTIALTSMGIAAGSYLMMLIGNR